MSERPYMKLPINADEGFPQAFRLNFNNNIYQILLYVNVLEAGLDTPEDYVYRLPETFVPAQADGATLPSQLDHWPTSEKFREAFMVMRVLRETSGEPRVIFQRKLIPNLEYQVDELVFVFRKMMVARQNLNGVGSFGSQILGGVAPRWAS